MRFLYRHFLRIGLTAAILLAAVPVLPAQAPLHSALPVPRILILNSYNLGYDWSEDEMEGVHDGLSKAFSRVEAFIEHLDTKKRSTSPPWLTFLKPSTRITISIS
ncbi:MAG: hypothetical protein ACOYL3_26490 [Desulfuromonadaceae bacterium]